MNACLFCRIVAGEIPAEFVYEDNQVVAFQDIDPKAPVHVLVVPRNHVADVTELDNPDLGGALLAACARIAADQGIAASGFRVVLNTGQDGGQSVAHLHLHLLGGRALGWPPG